jgi:hypothetical protein
MLHTLSLALQLVTAGAVQHFHVVAVTLMI